MSNAAAPSTDSAQQGQQHGQWNAITDVRGIEVGQYTRHDPPYLTGTTVVWAPDGAVSSVYVGGGWPGTVNTDVLDPAKNPQKLDAAFLTGGSYYGLDVYAGVLRWLEQHGYGMQVGPTADQIDPLVAGAVVFDLGRGGRFKSRPDANFGYDALQAARGGPVGQGNIGAGTGTTTHGGWPLKGGLGTASVLVGGAVVGAIVAVNAAGTPVDPASCGLRGTAYAVQNEFAPYQTPTSAQCEAAKRFVAAHPEAAPRMQRPAAAHPNTTIVIVATDAILTKSEAREMARRGNAGIGLALQPINTLGDGDSVFAMSTGKVAVSADERARVIAAVNEVVARAIAHAMLDAKSVRGFKSYCDLLPAACGRDARAAD